ncbi:hypothetical protein EJB05_00560, partial [Eragrostis curvula]
MYLKTAPVPHCRTPTPACAASLPVIHSPVTGLEHTPRSMRAAPAPASRVSSAFDPRFRIDSPARSSSFPGFSATVASVDQDQMRTLRRAGPRASAAVRVRRGASTFWCGSMRCRPSDVDATMLACIAFSCPNLQTLDISMANNAVNRITGDELTRFVSEKRSLSVLKLEGCSSLRFLNVINCSNLNELSLAFPKQNNASTDLISLMDSLGRTYQNLRNMHISSIHFCNEAVFALESANLRGLCMLSLILGSKITDAAVASIVRSCASLELLDLSGSGITDNGLRMICKSFPHTLTRLLLALCPNISSCGVQAAATQLPLLRLMDCGKSLCAKPQPDAGISYFGDITGGIKFCSKLATQKKQQPAYGKLIIKHTNLKKLSLWCCSAIDALYVNCPELVDLNLNSCTNLHPGPERVRNDRAADVLQAQRLADGLKRVQHLEGSEKWCGSRRSQCTVHIA